jgi:hypothetical protein
MGAFKEEDIEYLEVKSLVMSVPPVVCLLAANRKLTKH